VCALKESTNVAFKWVFFLHLSYHEVGRHYFYFHLFLQKCVSEQYESLEVKDAEIRQVKMALRERERDIEKASQMLLVTEETIDVSFCFNNIVSYCRSVNIGNRFNLANLAK
jgi:hypothetical protein